MTKEQKVAKAFWSERQKKDEAIKVLEQIIRILGPNPGCIDNKCKGCQYEMSAVLEIAKKAVKG